MKKIKHNVENEIEIKNSRFITLLINIDNPDISNILNDIKIKYPKATHYCYGYIYGDIKKSSDDGEPLGTASLPIMNVLEHENLNNILAVVVRYFGGIKLGAGGLIRAYTKSITEALKKCEYMNLEEGYKIGIEFNYNEEKKVDYILNNSKILEKQYNEKIIYTVLVNKDTLKKLKNYPKIIIEEVYIEKEDIN